MSRLSRRVFGVGRGIPSEWFPYPKEERLLISWVSYAGEITLWSGLSIVGFNALKAASTSPGAFLPGYFPYLAFLSPAFTYLLLKYASGVPLLEESAEKKWGDRADWKEYKNKVPVLFGLPGSKI
jgi:steroid 5-alpha reductase family enzyme